MNKYEFIYSPDERLRKPCFVVTSFSWELKKLSVRMFSTMKSMCGRGLAAPQVNQFINMFTINLKNKQCITVVNPTILECSGRVKGDEYCLSFPTHYDKRVKRNSWVRLAYQDIDGKFLEGSFNGIDAVCIQHEIDHLNGILLSDFKSFCQK